MTTYPHPHRVHVRRPHVDLWLVAVVGLAAALVGLASWVLVDRYAGGSSAAENATTLLDNFNAATTRGDAKAATALVTSDFVLSSAGTTIAGPKAFANEIGPHDGMTVDRIAPVSVNGDYATTFIHFRVAGIVDSPMLAVFQIRDGKVARLWTFVPGQTAPFTS